MVTECPVGFVRSKVMKPLPRPMFPATKDVPMILESYRALLGVEGQNWHSCLAWLLSALGATGTYSILLAKGEKGAGKSTRTKFLRRMIDPRRPEMTALPKDEENMAVQAQTCHVLAWDNLSYLPKVMSDAICRLASGDGLEKRGLYTNKDLCVLEATRPCILNGISDVAKEPDILERSLICTFRKVANRKSEKVLNRKFEDIHSNVLGALCRLVEVALRAEEEHPEDMELEEDVRMLGPCQFAIRAEQAAGLEEGDILRAYLGARDVSTDIAGEDDFVVALVSWIKLKGSWKGGAQDLLHELEDHVLGESRRKRPSWLPETGRKIRADLDRYVGTLRQLGVQLSYDVSGSGAKRKNWISLSYVPQDEEFERCHQNRPLWSSAGQVQALASCSGPSPESPANDIFADEDDEEELGCILDGV